LVLTEVAQSEGVLRFRPHGVVELLCEGVRPSLLLAQIVNLFGIEDGGNDYE
jgi:hypothetical protein